MTDWLHFVGRSYYTVKSFTEEALLYGASRRVSTRLLSAFNWEDRIWLAQGEKAMKTRRRPADGAEVFGYFTLTRISGLNPDIIYDLGRVTGDRVIKLDEGGERIERGCGEYTIGATYMAEVSITQLASTLRLLPPIEVLLQGPFYDYDPILLVDYTFRWGFQRINPDFVDVAEHNQATPAINERVVKGRFDVTNPDRTVVHPFIDNELQCLKQYHLAKPWSKPNYYE